MFLGYNKVVDFYFYQDKMYNSPENIKTRYQEFIDNEMKPEDARYLIRLMFELNRRGFEWYISTYFHKVEEYITKPIGCINDHGIDIEGSKHDGHRDIYLAAQCKKWYYTHEAVKRDQILKFDYDAKHRKNYKNEHNLYFVTTTNVGKDAKKVAKEKGIIVKDCRQLIEMREKYSLDTFKKDINKWKDNGKRLLNNKNTERIIDNYIGGHRIFFPAEGVTCTQDQKVCKNKFMSL